LIDRNDNDYAQFIIKESSAPAAKETELDIIYQKGKFTGAIQLINDMIQEELENQSMKEFRKTDKYKWLARHSDRIEKEYKLKK
jgi:hypothetical protein